MSILVLGGAGYIGSHAVYQLIDQQKKVVVIDNLSTGHRNAIHPKSTFYEGDMKNINFLRSVFEHEKVSTVMHFAANSLVGESMKKPLQYFNNNVYGTQVLLQVMHELNVKKIIFSSTAAVYGEPDSFPITELMQPHPENPYGETKLMMERMMKWVETAHGIKYVSLRYFNVAGARTTGEIGEDHHPETHLIPIILQVALKQRSNVTVFGDDYPTNDGSCIRDYVHVEDLIQAHLLALDYLEQYEKSNIFNLGSRQGFSVKEIIHAAESVTKKKIPHLIGSRRAGDPAVLVASSQKAESLLNWQAKNRSIETIIQDAWNWHRNHPNGYGKE